MWLSYNLSFQLLRKNSWWPRPKTFPWTGTLFFSLSSSIWACFWLDYCSSCKTGRASFCQGHSTLIKINNEIVFKILKSLFKTLTVLYFYVKIFIFTKKILYDKIIYITKILSSSVVERSAVNRLVVGSSPTWGDKHFTN